MNLSNMSGGIVSVILPTFNRPVGLKNALESLCCQTAPGKHVEIIVADNDPSASAKGYVESFAKHNSDIDIQYIHVSEPGVANARNAALDVAKGRYLAFLDDDQIAASNWLSTLVETCEEYGACLVFPPTRAQSPLELDYKTERLAFFHRPGNTSGTGYVDEFYGCGNSLLDRSLYPLPNPPFCLSTNETGGEDDRLFSGLQAKGGRIVWTDKTHVLEDVEDHRMSFRYIAIRSIAYGQGNSRLCAPPNPLKVSQILKSMVIGGGQFCVYSPLFVIFKLLKKPKWVYFMRKAHEGLGKVVWFEAFRPRLYGLSALKKSQKRMKLNSKPVQLVPNVESPVKTPPSDFTSRLNAYDNKSAVYKSLPY